MFEKPRNNPSFLFYLLVTNIHPLKERQSHRIEHYLVLDKSPRGKVRRTKSSFQPSKKDFSMYATVCVGVCMYVCVESIHRKFQEINALNCYQGLLRKSGIYDKRRDCKWY